MKFKLIVKLTEKLVSALGLKENEEYDVHLPPFLLAFGIILLAAAVGLAVAFFFVFMPILLVIAAIALVLGVSAFMCYRNQKIRVISDEEFEYTTFLGNTYVCRFSDIVAIRRNNDSLTVYVGNRKVHIESIAVVSERFADLVNGAMKGKK